MEDPEKRKNCNQILIILIVTAIIGVIAVTLIVTLPSNQPTKNLIKSNDINPAPQHRTLHINGKLPPYINFNSILTATYPGPFPFFPGELTINDNIFIKYVEGSIDGLYKIINLGSPTERWILEKIK